MKEQNKIVVIRLNQKLLNEIDKAIIDYPDVYNSKTHFIRASCIRELRRHKAIMK